MAVTFYDGPGGLLFMTGPAGGGNSTFNGPASERDIMLNPDAMARYQLEKQRAAREAEAAAAAEAPISVEDVHAIEVAAATDASSADIADAMAAVQGAS